MEFKNIAEGFWNLAKSELNIADDEVEKVAVWRYAKCLQCEHLNNENKTCNVCGCFMKAKVRASESVCPVGRW